MPPNTGPRVHSTASLRRNTQGNTNEKSLRANSVRAHGSMTWQNIFEIPPKPGLQFFRDSILIFVSVYFFLGIAYPFTKAFLSLTTPTKQKHISLSIISISKTLSLSLSLCAENPNPRGKLLWLGPSHADSQRSATDSHRFSSFFSRVSSWKVVRQRLIPEELTAGEFFFVFDGTELDLRSVIV